MGNQYYRSGSPVFWTEEKLDLLKRLRGQNKSFGKIANEIGCTKNQALAAWNKKILKKKFPSDLPEEKRPQTAVFSKPTLAWVPGVESGGKYKTGVFKHD